MHRRRLPVRAEAIAPRTWLLVALAVWSLLAWLAAVAGLGGWVAPVASDSALMQPLPQTRPTPNARLGPPGQYRETVTRPLFFADRRPKPFSLGGKGEGEEPVNDFNYVLTSVLLSPRLKLAILQPAQPEGEANEGQQPDGSGESIRVKLGESAEQAADWRLVSLEPRSAVFDGPEGERTLQLRVFDGTGATPATPATQPRAQPGRRQIRTRTANVPRPPRPAQLAVDILEEQPAPEAPEAPTGKKSAQENAAADPPTRSPEDQIEAIRQRIQARREQLRREAAGNAASGNTSPAQ